MDTPRKRLRSAARRARRVCRQKIFLFKYALDATPLILLLLFDVALRFSPPAHLRPSDV